LKEILKPFLNKKIMKFLTTDVSILERRTIKERQYIPSRSSTGFPEKVGEIKHEEIRIVIDIVSSGNTENIPSGSICHYVLEKLKWIEFE
jgi:hypothetical protein